MKTKLMKSLSRSRNGADSDGRDRDVAEYCALLRFTVNGAFGIDRPFTQGRRIYRAECWVEPETVLATELIQCVIDPSWEDYGELFVRNLPGFLNVEVVKFGSRSDPGTSTGQIVVGRSRIPLPTDFDCRRKIIFPLTKFDGGENKNAGDISVCMQLKELRMLQNPRFHYRRS